MEGIDGGIAVPNCDMGVGFLRLSVFVSLLYFLLRVSLLSKAVNVLEVAYLDPNLNFPIFFEFLILLSKERIIVGRWPFVGIINRA